MLGRGFSEFERYMTKPKHAATQERVLSFRKHPASHLLRSGKFIPYFQPLVDFRTGRITGFEVLARWHHPEVGLVLPESFIPQAESEGWIGELTQRMLDQALVDISVFRPRRMLSINVSPLQLLSSALPAQVANAADRAHFDLSNLTIEVTESAFTANRERAVSIARDLKSMGCRLALDDFGTGYSSLLHLQALPFDEIKVDRSFVHSMLCRRESRKIVAAVISLGQSLGILTVAEGIENEAQVEQLRWLGCDLGQGWLFGRPLPGSELASYTATFESSTSFCTRQSSSVDSTFDMNAVEQLAHLHALYQGAPVGLGFIDKQQRYRNVNQRLAEMNGLPICEHLGRTVQEVTPSLYPVIKPHLERVLRGEDVGTLTISMPHPLRGSAPGESSNSERARLVSYQPALDEAGEVIGASIAVIECGERGLALRSMSPQCEGTLAHGNVEEIRPRGTRSSIGPSVSSRDSRPEPQPLDNRVTLACK